jgi:hypothetical protein
MIITFNQPDGLYLSTQATLAQLLEDEALRAFAGGLLHAALVETCNLRPATFRWPKPCMTPAARRLIPC